MFVVQLANPNADAQKRMKRRGGGGHDVSRPRSVTPRSRSVTSTATRPPAPATPRSGRVSTPSTRKETLRQTNVPWARDKEWLKVLVHGVESFTRRKSSSLIKAENLFIVWLKFGIVRCTLDYPRWSVRAKNGFRTFYYNSEHRPGPTFYEICRPFAGHVALLDTNPFSRYTLWILWYTLYISMTGRGGLAGSELHYLFKMAWVKLEIIIWDKKDV